MKLPDNCFHNILTFSEAEGLWTCQECGSKMVLVTKQSWIETHELKNKYMSKYLYLREQMIKMIDQFKSVI